MKRAIPTSHKRTSMIAPAVRFCRNTIVQLRQGGKNVSRATAHVLAEQRHSGWCEVTINFPLPYGL